MQVNSNKLEGPELVFAWSNDVIASFSLLVHYDLKEVAYAALEVSKYFDTTKLDSSEIILRVLGEYLSDEELEKQQTNVRGDVQFNYKENIIRIYSVASHGIRCTVNGMLIKTVGSLRMVIRIMSTE